MKLRYVCCQPAIPYYTWQCEVLINNFIKMGVDTDCINIVCSIDNDVIPEDWQKLKEKYPVNFFFYNDNRVDKFYIPSVYFNLMKQHLLAHPELQNEVLFLHDSDIVFTRKPEFDSMIAGKSWFLSDTNSYINYDYIQQKGNHVYEKMCEIIGIDKLIPKLLNSNSGGAQYIVKNTTFEFWEKVELDSITLYKYFCEEEPNYKLKHDGDYPIQKWTAGMWSFLWNAWYFGHETRVDKRMDFGWVTNNYSDVETYTILHNAGVTDSNGGLFFKGEYINKLPYGADLKISPDRASSYYWNEICETALKTILK